MKSCDRILASIAWEQKYPLVTLSAMIRGGFDHTPLLINSRDATMWATLNLDFHLNYHGCVEMVL
jgi:hypothetical protein